MKPTSPWSVKGIDPEAREAAKLAARRADMSLGQWLSHTIRTAAAEQLKSGGETPSLGPTPSPQTPPRAAPAGDAGATGMTDTGTTGETGPTQTAPAEAPGTAPEGGALPPAPTTQAVLESINRLAAKIEETEHRTASAIAPIAEKVKELSEQIEDVKGEKGVETAPLERALSRVAERLDNLEEPAPPRVHEHRRRRREGLLSRFFSD